MSWDLNTNRLKTDSYYLEEFGNLKSKKWTQFYLFIYLFMFKENFIMTVSFDLKIIP